MATYHCYAVSDELVKLGYDLHCLTIFQIVEALNNVDKENTYFVVDDHTVSVSPINFGSSFLASFDCDFGFDQKDLSRFPHKCPYCNYPAYVSPITGVVDCFKKCNK